MMDKLKASLGEFNVVAIEGQGTFRQWRDATKKAKKVKKTVVTITGPYEFGDDVIIKV